ncbi:Nck-associated protein 1 [Trinorchestia longiramus]|nr:Nck-associated protein 1 [Trinorchestia longiramus]
MLSLVSTPHQLLNPALTDVLPCEYLPLETLERWVIFGMVLAPQQLMQHHPREVFMMALNTGWCITLFRDEVLHHHSAIQNFFESRKELSKRASEVKECYSTSVQQA